MNPLNTSLPRELRNAVRAAITAQPGWEDWRAAYLKGRSAADMRREETIAAANDLGVDIAAIAGSLGMTSNPPSTQQDPDTMDTAPASLTARDDADTRLKALGFSGGALHAAFEGRDPETLVNEA